MLYRHDEHGTKSFQTRDQVNVLILHPPNVLLYTSRTAVRELAFEESGLGLARLGTNDSVKVQLQVQPSTHLTPQHQQHLEERAYYKHLRHGLEKSGDYGLEQHSSGKSPQARW